MAGRVVGAVADELQGARLCAGSQRRVLMVRKGKRRLFDAAARKTFLEWFSVTCNVRFSAERAGVSKQTVWRHRIADPIFREAWELALDQGYARIEAKIIETTIDAKPIEIDGEPDVPDLEITNPDLFRAMLREHRDRRDKEAGSGRARRHGPKAGAASDAELLDALVKRLQAFGIRVRQEDEQKALAIGGDPQ